MPNYKYLILADIIKHLAQAGVPDEEIEGILVLGKQATVEEAVVILEDWEAGRMPYNFD